MMPRKGPGRSLAPMSGLFGSADVSNCSTTSYHGAAQNYREATGDFPDPHLLRLLLRSIYSSHKGPFIFHLDYGRLRYVYLLRYNAEVVDCVENKLLQSIYDAHRNGVEDLLWQETKDCLRLFWPFLKADYEVQLARCKEVGADGSAEKVVRNIELRTTDGTVQAREHSVKTMHYDVRPIENTASNLELFTKDEVVVMEKLSFHVFKVNIKDTDYVLKELPLGSLDTAGERCFRREFELLQKIPRHPNLVWLVGVRDAGEGKIDGIVLPYISGRSLAALDGATVLQKDNWKKQISDAVGFLHEKDIVWGDVKTENIMIDERSDNAVLIDFGGGITPGWIDRGLGGTKKGDLQGLSRVFEFIDNLKAVF